MRVMFTTTGSAGHLGPLIPFADAVRNAGGEVLIATRESSAEQARATGFDVWAFADAPAPQRGAALAAARGLPVQEANARMAGEVFGGMDARAALPGLLEACATWRPDVLVSEPSEFAGRAIGPQLGVPTVILAITQYAVERHLEAHVDAALLRLRREHGLAEGRGAGSARFTLMPPLLEDPALPGPPDVQRFREDAPTTRAWTDGDPLVYLTLGSVAPQRDDVFPGLYAQAIEALAPLPVRVLVTIGRDRDPAQLGPVPANVEIERWIPQADVMPHTRVLVSHGGSGTLRAGLAAGIPQVVLPIFADQPYNARRVDALGAGIAIEDTTGLAAAVRAILEEDHYARSAATVAADIRNLPPVEHAAARLRELAEVREAA